MLHSIVSVPTLVTTTGISSVENKVEKADAPVYNLAGQLVGKDYKGLVIKNGKKFVIK